MKREQYRAWGFHGYTFHLDDLSDEFLDAMIDSVVESGTYPFIAHRTACGL